MGFLKTVVEGVRAAYKMSKEKEHDTDVAELLQDLAWHREPLNLELMAMLIQSDYDPQNRDLLQLISRLKSGTSTTKDLIESCFAHLTDVSRRQSKNQRLGRNQKWLYATSSPYANSSCPQFLPDGTAWQSYKASEPSLATAFSKMGNIKAGFWGFVST